MLHAQKLDDLDRCLDFIEMIIRHMESDLEPPLLVVVGDQDRAYRYGRPTIANFAFLHFIRVLSALRAGTTLARAGFVQEIYVLIRTIYEYLSKIEYVCDGYFDGEIREKSQKYVEDYFSDFSRHAGVINKDKSPRQKEINKAIQDNYERMMARAGMTEDMSSNANSRRYILSTFGNYVHARYPEVMDMFGGSPARAHMRGMLGTIKDEENSIQLESAIESVELTLKNVVRRFGYNNSESTPKLIREWANNLKQS